MKRNILAIITLLLTTSAFAQKESIQWGQDFKSDAGILGYDFGGINGKYYYTIESFKGQSTITVSDLNHNVINKQTIKYKNDDFRIQVVDHIKTNADYYFIVRGIDLKNDKALIGYVTTFPDGNINPDIKDLLIYDWDIKALDNGEAYLSNDKSKIFISYSPHKKGQQSSKIQRIVLSNKMERLPNESISKLDNLIASKIKIKGTKVEDVSIKTLSNGKKIAVGTYTNFGNTADKGVKVQMFGANVASTMTGVNGIFYANLDSNGVTSSKLFPFTEDVAEKMGVSKNKLDKGIPELIFHTYFSEKDNNVAIFLEEESSEFKGKVVNSNVNSYSRVETGYSYETNSLIASNFNEKGELQFMTVIDKTFTFHNMVNFSSFFAFKKDQNFYFLFNVSKFSVDNKKDLVAKGRFLTNLVKLDNKGNMVSQETLFGNKDIDLLVAPLNSYKIDDNKILLYGIKGTKITYGTLEVK